jgi:HEAT repeat protein
MTAIDALSPAMRTCLDRFSDESWRERKRAAEDLVRLIEREQPDASTVEALVDVLLDHVLTPGSVSARAAAQEVLAQLGRVCIPQVLGRLDIARPETRLLVDLLGTIGGRAEVGVLVELVSAPAADANLRASAATALGALGGAAAIEALESLLREPSEMLQLYALDALRTARAVVPVPAVLPLIQNPIMRKAAVAVMGSSHAPEALPVLVPLLVDSMAGVRAAAAVALVRLHGSMVETGKAGALAAALERVGAATQARIRELIEQREGDERSAAITLAALVGDPGAVGPLLHQMDDPVVHEQALGLVARLGPAANAALVEASAHVEAGSREQLLRLIGAVRADVIDPRLLDLLRDGLEDAIEAVACAAADALRRVGTRASMGALYRGCAAEGALGEHAADALAEVTARVGGGRLDELSLIIGDSWPHEGALARNLCRVAGKLRALDYVPPLVSMIGSSDPVVRSAAAHALGHIPGDHEGVGALCFALADEEQGVRAAACRSLGLLRSPPSCQPLLSATADPSQLVRAAAAQALVAIDNPVSLARMREIVLDDPSPTVVVQAIAGLGSSGLDQDLNLLMSLCSSEDHEVVKAAARALTRHRAHRATAALLGLLSHDRWDVRWAAAEVLAVRGDPTASRSLERAREVETDALVREVLDRAVEALATAEGSTGHA